MCFQKRLKEIVESRPFNYIVLVVILFSAILVGISLDTTKTSEHYILINILENIILFLFCIELIIRIFSEEKPLDFFKDPWNLFDFLIVAICFIPLQSKAIYVLRLIRVLRTFRLFRAFPNLKPVIQGMLSSVSSVFFVAMLLIVIVYIYAVIGVSLFGSVDSVNFGTLWRGLFTLFQILTLENWNTIMLPANSIYPVGGPIYFISFIIIGTMVIMNLFLGIIVGNMTKAMDKLNSPESMREYLDEDAEREQTIEKRLKAIEQKIDKIAKRK